MYVPCLADISVPQHTAPNGLGWVNMELLCTC